MLLVDEVEIALVEGLEPFIPADVCKAVVVAAEVDYEPNWDGFRCIAFRDGDEVELQSRSGRPLARYFPEIVDVLGALGQPRFVIDGELVLVRDGLLDFAALMRRLHPAASLVA